MPTRNFAVVRYFAFTIPRCSLAILSAILRTSSESFQDLLSHASSLYGRVRMRGATALRGWRAEIGGNESDKNTESCNAMIALG